jgi:hypothetical protein
VLPGTLIQDVRLHLPFGGHTSVDIAILSCVALKTDHGSQYRLGGEFAHLQPEQLLILARAIQKAEDSHIEEVQENDFSSLWAFYFESGFIYSKKRRQMAHYSEKIFHTHRCLFKGENSVFKMVVYKNAGEIKGHISAVRLYDRSWLAQHLSAEKTDANSTAKMVLGRFIDFFNMYQLNLGSEPHYLVFFYQEENVFTSILYAGVRERIADPLLCYTREFDYCLPGQAPTEALSDWPVRNASHEDLVLLEKVILARKDFNYYLVEGLAPETITSLHISREYGKIGLYRYRRVLVVQDPADGATCFAVCNFSSPGLNFSELTNSIRIYFGKELGASNQKLADIVASAALESYALTDMPNPVLLLDEGQPVPISFVKSRRYQYFVISLSCMNEAKDAMTDIIEHFRVHMRKRNQLKAARSGR